MSSKKYWPVTTFVLWLLKIAGYAYFPWLPASISRFLPVLEALGTPLCLLPLLLTGAIISQRSRNRKQFYCTGFVISLSLLCLEAFFLKQAGQDAVSYIFFTLPTAYFLYNTILATDFPWLSKLSPNLAAISMFVYCIHPIFVDIFSRFLQNTMLRFLFSAVVSSSLGYIYTRAKSKRS